ncbi:MAG: glycosyltransferase [Herbaspirillum sp.]
MDELQEHPLVTLALFAYNQERYIHQAIEAAFAQTYSPLEVILTDDHSSDATFSHMQAAAAAYIGPHTVRLNRNSRRLGVAGHVNKVDQLAQGVLVVAAAGDDISYPQRVTTIAEAWIEAGRPSALLHSAYDDMDLSGGIHGTLVRESPRGTKDTITSNVVTGATEAWSRRLFEVFGPISPCVTHEDRVLGTRAALLDGIIYISRSLVAYRRGGISSQGSETSRFERRRLAARRYVADMAQMICDLDLARQKKLISDDSCNALIAAANDRLARELLLASTASRNSGTKLILLELPRVIRRIAFVIYRVIHR